MEEILHPRNEFPKCSSPRASGTYSNPLLLILNTPVMWYVLLNWEYLILQKMGGVKY